ncbi:hypothetical protein WMY93_000472 [Mugilogobius chulae]|uniref:RING/Ubox-like zinc-binding domain-containing protein n=1 Tax=Mugilogobius chulae TaxID=88201 RepID=A0AAW0Q552_9GOBI
MFKPFDTFADKAVVSFYSLQYDQEFFFKCASHPTSQDDRSVALDLVTLNSRKVPCIACMDVMDVVVVFSCAERHVICLDLRPLPWFRAEQYLLGLGGLLCPGVGCGAGLVAHGRRVECDVRAGCGLVFCRDCRRDYHQGACPSVEGAGSGAQATPTQQSFPVDSEASVRSRWDRDSLLFIKESTKPCPQCGAPEAAVTCAVLCVRPSGAGSVLCPGTETRLCVNAMDRVGLRTGSDPGPGLHGVENPGLEMEMTEVRFRDDQRQTRSQDARRLSTEQFQISPCCGEVGGSLGLVLLRPMETTRNKLWEAQPEVRYRGLAGDAEDELDSSMNMSPDLNQDLNQDQSQDRPRDLNKRLLNHFRELAAHDHDTDQVDLDLLDELLSDGADPNSSDRFGQTVLHEISRAWSVDVMRFFLDRGSDLLTPDQFGVTALHVASALDYSDMVLFLLQRNGLKHDPESRTLLQSQTPLHFAAKCDAVSSIRVLVQHGASLSSVDYKLRTPLQLAANCDAARVLLELGAEAGLTDADGQLCITALICHMSPVADLALSQFHVHDTMSRQQFFHLNLLEPEPVEPHSKEALRLLIESPGSEDQILKLEVVVQQGKLDLIMNPVFLKLIEVKWRLYGRKGAWLLLILNFLFNVSWTTVAISVSVTRDSPQRYVLPQDWWRVLLAVVALLFTLEEVLREVIDIRRSNRKLRLQRKWAQRRIHDDLRSCHPMWPQDRVFLQDQLKSVLTMRGNYSRDLWNLSDWLVYCLLGVSTAVHVADVVRPSNSLHVVTLRLFSVAVIFLWLRLMKYVRAFRRSTLHGHGGRPAVHSLQMTLVDEYDYTSMKSLDPVMAPLLCGTFLAASSILCVNLLIAMVTDTFQRVHDNSKANAVMQQAAVVLQLHDSLPVLAASTTSATSPELCAAGRGRPRPTSRPPAPRTQPHHATGQNSTQWSHLQLKKSVTPTLTKHVNWTVQTPQNVKSREMSVNEELRRVRSELREVKSLLQQLLQDKNSQQQQQTDFNPNPLMSCAQGQV